MSDAHFKSVEVQGAERTAGQARLEKEEKARGKEARPEWIG